MKKRFLSAAFAVAFLISAMLSVWAEEKPAISVDSQTEVLGAIYTDYSIYGKVADNTADVHTVEFNPENGLIPLAYVANAGHVDVAADHIAAAEAEGYTVVGAINGSFFEMATGNPCGTLISDGKLVFTHSGLANESIAAFDYDGKFHLVSSTLRFTLKIAGKNYPAGIGLVNKKYSACSLASSDITGRLHYYDIDAADLADETVTGYEIILEKLDNTELSVGKTLSAKVLEIKTDSYYGATKITEENKFVLFVKPDSKFMEKVSEVVAGDGAVIEVAESDTRYTEIMNNASSAISSCYWLVKDGVDVTDTTSTIIHSTSLARAWTAFGVKEDGTYVYWASEEVTSDGEKAITLKDVADAMIEMGCVNVIRLDGGGSTSITINGVGSPISTTRAVCDMLLIVEKDDLKSEAPVAKPENSEPETSTEESLGEISEAVESSEDRNVAEDNLETEESQGEASSSTAISFSGVIIAIISVPIAVVAIIVIIFVVLSKRKK